MRAIAGMARSYTLVPSVGAGLLAIAQHRVRR